MFWHTKWGFVCSKMINNLFVTSKKTKPPIHEFKVLQKGQRVFLNPLLMVYYFLL